jgi:class 3 adenylate cyclase
VDAAARAGCDARAGLHIGECERPEGPIASGPAVQVAQSIRRQAQPAEVLCSETLRNLVAGSGILFEPAAGAGDGGSAPS